MDLMNKKVIVIGMAKSGLSAAEFLKRKGADVTVYDGKPAIELKEQVENLTRLWIRCQCGTRGIQDLEKYELMVLSPGVPTDLDFINEARSLGVKVVGEVELAYWFNRSMLLGITGTNGKTTTTSLVGKIITEYERTNLIVGNIGIPFTKMVDKTKPGGMIVAELSSFQLESIEHLHCHVSALLNITPDHINRHKTLENYIAAKNKIFENSTENDYLILNYEDEECRRSATKTKAKVIYFSLKHKLNEGVYLNNQDITLVRNGEHKVICQVKDLKVLGDYNIENVMAAVGITAYAGVPMEVIRKAVLEFDGVVHRNEYVDTIKGVRYYNDSKATNEDAAIKGLTSMRWPVVLIGGGMDKGSDFSAWTSHFNGRVKDLILFGETSDKIKGLVEKKEICPVHQVKDLKEAVELANRLAKIGECVLLSPACASWDMFKSFEERGDLFKQYVAQLKG